MGKGLHTPWKLIDRIFHSSDSLKLLAAKQGLHGLSLTKCEIFKSAYVKFNSSDASSELKELQGSRIPLSLSTLTGQPILHCASFSYMWNRQGAPKGFITTHERDGASGWGFLCRRSKETHCLPYMCNAIVCHRAQQ